MPYQIRVRRDTAANWSDNNPILALGEIGYVTNENRFKIGDGNLAWNSLPFTCDIASLDGFPLPAGNPGANNTLVFDASTNQWTYAAGGAGGGVTSVGLTMPSPFTVTAGTSPVTSSGTIAVTLDNQTANQVFAGPTNGAAAPPTFRALVSADIPNLAGTYQVTDTSLQSIITATDPGTGVGAGNMLYLTGTKTFTGTPLTAFGRSLVDDADATAARTTLGFDTVDSLATSPQSKATIQQVKAGVVLAKGEVVYVSGATGDNLNVLKAQADTEATSSKTIGIMMQAAANVGDLAYVMTEGLLTGLNTGSEVAGTPVWLSPSTAGGWTTTKPTSPNHLVFLGWIVKVNASSGSIYVKVANGQELDELHDVAITSVANNHVLQYDTSTTPATWKNKTLANAGIAASSHTHGNITNAGAINSTANLPLITTTGGVITTGSFGTTANTFCQGNDSRLDLQTITLTGNVTGSGTGSFATTIATGVITPSMFSTAGATSGDVIKYNGTAWALAQDATGSGSGTPGGNTTEVQYNNSGAFAGSSNFTWTNGSSLLTVNGNIQLSAQGDLRFADANSSNYVAFQAPATVSTDVTWTLPAADGSANQVLSTDGSGTLSWATAAGSVPDFILYRLGIV